MLYLIMPEINQEITVKVIDLAYTKGEEFYLPIIIWGDPKNTRFEMKLGKTLWHSIEDYLNKLEDDEAEFSEFLGERAFKIDEDLSCLKNKIITIRGIPDTKRSLVDKKGNVVYPKIFNATFQRELEEAETAGKEIYTEAVFKYVINDYSCRECRLLNVQMAKEEEEKKKEKEKKIVEREEKKKSNKKKVEKAKGPENCGWI